VEAQFVGAGPTDDRYRGLAGADFHCDFAVGVCRRYTKIGGAFIRNDNDSDDRAGVRDFQHNLDIHGSAAEDLKQEAGLGIMRPRLAGFSIITARCASQPTVS
jgi:hypothetical protein